MRKLFILFLLVQVPANAASHYVDNMAVGANNGNSWADAWTSCAGINWAAVNPGDTIYISGGTGSQSYFDDTMLITRSGTVGNPIYIRPGVGPGHDGIVLHHGGYIGGIGTSYIYISGGLSMKFAFTDFFNPPPGERTFGNKLLFDNSTGLVVEYCNFTNVNQMVSLVGATGFRISHNHGTDVRGDAAIRAVNCPDHGFDSHLVEYNDIELSRYVGGDPTIFGPDGVQGSHGLTIRYNHFRIKDVLYGTSTQHPDYCQVIGNHNKYYGNNFENIADSAIDMDFWANPTPHDIWIFNNYFHCTRSADPYPQYIRFYASAGKSITSITNLRIQNNDFIDMVPAFASIEGSWGAGPPPTMSGCLIRNNLFVSADAPYSILYSASASLNPSHNAYYSPYGYWNYLGTNYTTNTWSTVEPTARYGMPAMVKYSHLAADNDPHLLSSDTVAWHQGVDPVDFNFDADGKPISAPFNIGAYGTGATNGTPNSLVVNVNVLNVNTSTSH